MYPRSNMMGYTQLKLRQLNVSVLINLFVFEVTSRLTFNRTDTFKYFSLMGTWVLSPQAKRVPINMVLNGCMSPWRYNCMKFAHRSVCSVTLNSNFAILKKKKNPEIVFSESKKIIWAYNFAEKKRRRVFALFKSIFFRNRSLRKAR